MEGGRRKVSDLLALLIFLSAIAALGIEFRESIWGGNVENTSVLFRIYRYFSFMTILTNWLVALTAFASMGFLGRVLAIFRRPMISGGVLIYIVFVSLGFHILFSQQWRPEGILHVANLLLHYIIPLCYVVWWLIFTPAGHLRSRFIAMWLLYPALYFVFVSSVGHLIDYFPYYFLDIEKMGGQRVLLQIGKFGLAYIVLGFLLVTQDRLRAKSLR